jgi:hypothetical protein
MSVRFSLYFAKSADYVFLFDKERKYFLSYAQYQ